MNLKDLLPNNSSQRKSIFGVCPACRKEMDNVGKKLNKKCPKCQSPMYRQSTSIGAAWALPDALKHLRAGNLFAIAHVCPKCHYEEWVSAHRHDVRAQKDKTDGVKKPMLTTTTYDPPDFQTTIKLGPFPLI